MEALRASYDSTSDSDSSPKSSKDFRHISNTKESDRLPPPPIALIQSPPPLAYCQTSQESRVRSFPHVEGNYALHVFIPVLIPPVIKKELILALKRVASLVPSLHAVDVDIPLSDMCKDDGLLEQFLGREFHISLGRTVPIRVHQIGSVVTMLRQKLQSQNRNWIDFSKWEVFVNDDQTRSFLSMEVTAGGLSEVRLSKYS
ncbi:uncharacterized protein LOC131248070 [Magnolia sinica]|uniref:uncharacterized protein LOC131248070 n=1 Tax=Magnolia sinica TaxID=86752 RepID=UPI00265ABF30|nr:uncharacterized protein LOC131248070 [Magnolia sinica]